MISILEVNKLKLETQNDLYNVAHVICFHLNTLEKYSGIKSKGQGQVKENKTCLSFYLRGRMLCMEFRKTTICIALERPHHNLEFLYKWVVVGGGGSGTYLVTN